MRIIKNNTPNIYLNTGDLLYRNKGCVQHVGVYYMNGLVAHNSPDNNAEIVTLNKFANQLDIKVKSNNFSVDEQLIIINNIKQSINKKRKYNAITNNCEHFVTCILTSCKHSEQLKSIALGCSLGCVTSLLTKSKHIVRNTLLTGGAFLLCTNFLRKYNTKIMTNMLKIS